MRTQLRITSIVAALILSATAMAASPKCRSSDFACFKRKMMPQVGRRITVEGILASAKLGWLVTFEHWGVYVYNAHESDGTRMNTLDNFNGQRVKLMGTLRYAPGSPSQRTDAASIPEHFFFDMREVKVISPRAVAEIKFRELRMRKPPLVELYFDIALRNDRAEPRWFLLPSNLGPGTSALLTKGGIDGVEVFGPRGKGRVVVGHFLGTGGFYALLLPARAEVHLRMFPISYWGDVPNQLEVEVVTAKRLTIGGEPAAAWFGLNPTSSRRADIPESVLTQNRMLRSRHTPDRKEVVTLIEEESRFRIEVSLREMNKISGLIHGSRIIQETSVESRAGSIRSRPGNSSNPPTAIPKYMAVIVASSIQNDGSVISGDVRKIIVVRTNPGYGRSPGHAGTGQVVAIICATPNQSASLFYQLLNCERAIGVPPGIPMAYALLMSSRFEGNYCLLKTSVESVVPRGPSL